MKLYHRIIPAVLLVLLIATIIGLVMTNRPIDAPTRRSSYRDEPSYQRIIAIQDQFETAQELAASAVTRQEQWMAREALRIADSEVDLAFATALQEATEHPAPLSPEAQAISERLKKAQAQVDLDQGGIERLNKLLAGAKESAKETLQRQLQMLQAQADLDQDELDDAHHDLRRAGGDQLGTIQGMKERYEAREQAKGGLQSLVPAGTQNSVEEKQSRDLVTVASAWYPLHGKLGQLQQAEQGAQAQAAELKDSREKLTQEERKRRAEGPASSAEGTNAARSSGATMAAPANSRATELSSLKMATAAHVNLKVIDKRIEDETQLADTYHRWSTFVRERQRQCVHRILLCLLWILIIASVTTIVDIWVSRSLTKLAADHRQTYRVRSVTGYAIRGVGVILILLVIFGPPTQFAALLAVAGAGLTLVLKDFIVAFIGWFVLIGRNGIRVGDWVEINGVSGEVLEIGPMRTILLETGDWSDAGHPTGRKVVFMNGFAVEGNYFNFSTSGQWMWDEIQTVVPADCDPFATAEAVKQIVTAETQKNAQLATDEWRKVAPGAAAQAFRGEPVVSVRPTGSGADLVIRYITRADERHEVRSRIYRAMIDLQHRKDPLRLEPGGAVR